MRLPHLKSNRFLKCKDTSVRACPFFIIAPVHSLIKPLLVTKPALGRSLGNLLEGSRKSASPEGNPVPVPDQLNLTSVTPGLGSLLRGSGAPARDELPLDAPLHEAAPNLFGPSVAPASEKPATSQTQPEEIAPSQMVPIGLVQLSLIVADVMMQGLTWMLIRTQSMSEFWVVSLSFVSVSLGAWLACLAVFLEPDSSGKTSGHPLKK